MDYANKMSDLIKEKVIKQKVVFATPWFDLLAKYLPSDDEPHYSIRTHDYVTVVALTTEKRIVLVRQYRPAVGKITWELPSGHVEPDETPEEAARKELLEETGYVAERIELLGDLLPDTGRMGNRMWCYFASNAFPATNGDHKVEQGIEVIIYDGSISELMYEEDFRSALNVAALFLAVLQDRLPL